MCAVLANWLNGIGKTKFVCNWTFEGEEGRGVKHKICLKKNWSLVTNAIHDGKELGLGGIANNSQFHQKMMEFG